MNKIKEDTTMKKNLILTMTLILKAMTVFAQNNDGRISAKGFAAYEKKGHFKPYEFTRHAVGDHDIQTEMLDYPVKNCIYPEGRVIEADGKQTNEAYQNVLNENVKFRYVIDMKTFK